MTQAWYIQQLMFEWKNLNLTVEDYESYSANDDLAKITCTIHEMTEWKSLYSEALRKSVDNQRIKRQLLVFENKLVPYLDQHYDTRPGELAELFSRSSQDLKMHLTPLMEQLGLLHVRNISSTVEFTVSRLISLQEALVRVLAQKEEAILRLQRANVDLELSHKGDLCHSCHEMKQKRRNEFIKQQIIASEEPEGEEEGEELGRVRRYVREELQQEHNQEVLNRFNFLNGVEQVLQNRERVARCHSTPIEAVLSEYLHSLLRVLENHSLQLPLTTFREFEKIRQNFESMNEIKGILDKEELGKSHSAREPYSKLMSKINKFVHNKISHGSSHRVRKEDMPCQTTPVKQLETLKKVEKNRNQLAKELEALRSSKAQTQKDLLHKLEVLHKSELKCIELNSGLKAQQKEITRLEQINLQLEKQLKQTKQEYKDSETKILEQNALEKASQVRSIKLLQMQVEKLKQAQKKPPRANTEAQTDLTHSQIQVKESEEYRVPTLKTYRTLEKQLKSSKQVDFKKKKRNVHRTSIDMEAMPSDLKHKKRVVEYEQENQEPKFPILQSVASFGLMLTKTDGHQVFTQRGIEEKRDKQVKFAESSGGNKKFKTKKKLLTSKNIRTQGQDYGCYPKSSRVLGNPLSVGPSSARMTPKHRHQQSIVAEESDGHILTVERIEAPSEPQAMRRHQKWGSCGKVQGSQKDYNSCLASPTHQLSKIKSHKRLQELEVRLESYIAQVEEQNRNNTEQQQADQSPEPTLQKTQELTQLLTYCIVNYEQLKQRDFFSNVYTLSQPAMDIKVHTAPQKIETRGRLAEKKACALFFGMEEAEKYEQGKGIWSQLDSCIMVDNKYSAVANKVEAFLLSLKDRKRQVYEQCMVFLKKPHQYLWWLKSKDREAQCPVIGGGESDRTCIPNLFKRMFRLHKLLHKNCHHVQQFLDMLGFYTPHRK